MNGVMIPSVSAGSSQREASVMWTPHVIVPSGAADAGTALPRSSRAARDRTPERTVDGLIGRLLSGSVAASATRGRVLSSAFWSGSSRARRARHRLRGRRRPGYLRVLVERMRVKVFNRKGQLVGPVETAPVEKTDEQWPGAPPPPPRSHPARRGRAGPPAC